MLTKWCTQIYRVTIYFPNYIYLPTYYASFMIRKNSFQAPGCKSCDLFFKEGVPFSILNGTPDLIEKEVRPISLGISPCHLRLSTCPQYVLKRSIQVYVDNYWLEEELKMTDMSTFSRIWQVWMIFFLVSRNCSTSTHLFYCKKPKWSRQDLKDLVNLAGKYSI